MSDREIMFHRWGWALFVISSAFYIIASIEGRSLTGFLGGVFFLIACVVFLIPLFDTEE